MSPDAIVRRGLVRSCITKAASGDIAAYSESEMCGDTWTFHSGNDPERVQPFAYARLTQ